MTKTESAPYIFQKRALTAELIAKLRHDVTVGGGYADVARDDLEALIAAAVVWKPLSEHPKNSKPFWLGTASGGVLIEAFHWCTDQEDFVGLITDTQFRFMAKTETYLFAEMQAPKKVAS